MNQEELLIACCSGRWPLARACNRDKAHFSLGAYLFELIDRGASKAHADAIRARVEAARKAPIVWAEVKAALALYRAHGPLPFVEDDRDD
jgi:hypothetical protein